MRTACDLFFFFNDTATTEIYTLSLHDALPIYDDGIVDIAVGDPRHRQVVVFSGAIGTVLYTLNAPHVPELSLFGQDRKSTRLNSSHANISYAVFCLKKKTKGNDYVSTV